MVVLLCYSTPVFFSTFITHVLLWRCHCLSKSRLVLARIILLGAFFILFSIFDIVNPTKIATVETRSQTSTSFKKATRPLLLPPPHHQDERDGHETLHGLLLLARTRKIRTAVHDFCSNTPLAYVALCHPDRQPAVNQSRFVVNRDTPRYIQG